MRPVVIGLYSPVMGSGKSVVANYLINERGFALVKFAGPLKNMMRSLLRDIGMDPEEIERRVEGDLKAEPIEALGNVTSRHLMQNLGSAWGREAIYQDFWSDIAIEQIGQHLDAGRSVVVDDMRFPNEYETIRAFDGGKCVKLVRPSVPLVATATEGQLEGHAFDHLIINDGTIEDLERRTENAYGRLAQA